MNGLGVRVCSPPGPFKLLLAQLRVLSPKDSQLEKEKSKGSLQSLYSLFFSNRTRPPVEKAPWGCSAGCWFALGNDVVQFHACLYEVISIEI